MISPPMAAGEALTMTGPFLHALLRHAAADLHHAERRDERRHAEMRNQNARAFAQQHAEQNTDGDGDDIRRNTGDTQTGQQTGGAAVNQRHDDHADRHHRRADRQINAARNDDERHAQRDDAHARVVAQDVDPVSGKRRKPLAEGRIIEPQRENLQNHHHQKRDSRRKQRFPLPVIGEPRISRRLPAA